MQRNEKLIFVLLLVPVRK